MDGGGVDFNGEVKRIRELRQAAPRLGAGERPAVVVVDFQVTFMDDTQEGPRRVLEASARLLDGARAAGVPVVYGVMGFDSVDQANLRWSRFADMTRFLPGAPTAQIHPLVTRRDTDHVVAKRHASVFHRTGLHELLQQLGIDTVYVIGTTTSGCLRATAVDAAGYSYRTIVVEDCSWDHRPLSREAALLDLADRYADVISLDTALAELGRGGAGNR